MLSVIIAGALALAAPQQQQLDTTIAVRANGRLEVDAYAGSVTVRSWNRNEVRVQATHGRNADVEVSYRGNAVSVDGSPSGQPSGREEVRFTISVPRSFAVSVDGVNVAATVDGIDADVSVETVNGAITIRNVNGRVDAESVSGLIVISGVRGDVTASGSNQSMQISNVTGDVDAEGVNGSISITGVIASNVTAETVNGGIVIGTTIRDGGHYSAATTNGSITLAIPEGTNASIDVSTFSGQVDSRLPNLTVDRRRGGSFTMRIGTGSARVELEAFSGTIQLVRPADIRAAGSK